MRGDMGCLTPRRWRAGGLAVIMSALGSAETGAREDLHTRLSSRMRTNLERRQEELQKAIRDHQRPVTELARERGITAFGVHPVSEELLMADFNEGKVKKLVQSSQEESEFRTIPDRLSDSGFFKDVESLEPADGVIPYKVNSPFWSDYAIKRRWVSLPDNDKKVRFDADGNWEFPEGTVWIKHFELETVRGDPESRKRIETRLLFRNADGVNGVTYRWNDSETEAYLVDEEGGEETFKIVNENGELRSQEWRYPSRDGCLRCHTEVGGLALGGNTAQMNRQIEIDGRSINQIRQWAEAGRFSEDLSVSPQELPQVSHIDEPSFSVEHRARSYLAVNCSQCHQPRGPGQGIWDARFSKTLDETRLVNGFAINNLGNSEARLIKPGSLNKSVLYQRVAHLGEHHMPPLATKVLNEPALRLLERWIRDELPHKVNGENVAPTVEIVEPAYEAPIRVGEDVRVLAAAADSDGEIDRMEFFIGGDRMGVVREPPYKQIWVPADTGEIKLEVVAYDRDGAAASDQINLAVLAPNQNPEVAIAKASTLGDRFLAFQVGNLMGLPAVLEQSSDLIHWRPTESFRVRSGKDARFVLPLTSLETNQKRFFRLKLKRAGNAESASESGR